MCISCVNDAGGVPCRETVCQSFVGKEKSIDIRLDSKSIRLDVYVNDENGTIFNIEMQTTKDMYELAKHQLMN